MNLNCKLFSICPVSNDSLPREKEKFVTCYAISVVRAQFSWNQESLFHGIRFDIVGVCVRPLLQSLTEAVGASAKMWNANKDAKIDYMIPVLPMVMVWDIKSENFKVMCTSK